MGKNTKKSRSLRAAEKKSIKSNTSKPLSDLDSPSTSTKEPLEEEAAAERNSIRSVNSARSRPSSEYSQRSNFTMNLERIVHGDSQLPQRSDETTAPGLLAGSRRKGKARKGKGKNKKIEEEITPVRPPPRHGRMGTGRNDPDTARGDRPPALDRSVDLAALAKNPQPPNEYEQVFFAFEPVSSMSRLFSLDATIKRRIYGFCFPYEARKISLSPSFATKALFHADYFADPWDVVDDAFGGFMAFSILRKELMAYFWSTFHFHITVNKFIGPKFSPLSHDWIYKHLDTIQSLTIEIDCTRFGLSELRAAPSFGYNMHKEENILTAIFHGILVRKGTSTMRDITLLCRRYAGVHVHNDHDFTEKYGQEPILYCPESVTQLCDAICDLRGTLQNLRMAGFPLGYTKLLLSALFADEYTELEYFTPNASAWPPLPVKNSELISGANMVNAPQLEELKQFPRLTSSTSQRLQLRLKRSPSLAEEIDTEIASRTSSSYNAVEEEEEDQTLDGENGGSFAKSSIGRVSFPEPACTPTTPSFQGIGDVSEKAKGGKKLKASVTFAKLSPPPPSRQSTPDSPNAMNKKNEQDPAFIRAISAMGRATPSVTTNKCTSAQPLRSSIEGEGTPDRYSTGTSMGGNNRGNVRKKASDFVNKIRGKE